MVCCFPVSCKAFTELETSWGRGDTATYEHTIRLRYSKKSPRPVAALYHIKSLIYSHRLYWMRRHHTYFKGPPTTKPVLVKKFTCKIKMAFLSRKSILLAILLHGQFIRYTQISFHPNIHVFTAQQRVYQSFLSNFLV